MAIFWPNHAGVRRARSLFLSGQGPGAYHDAFPVPWRTARPGGIMTTGKRILGISAYYHDSAAALVVDGRIVAAAQEERFTRGQARPGLSHHAVDYCLAGRRVDAARLRLCGLL